MNERPPSITFFYPARQVGGAEFLFLRLAAHLSETGTADVSIVDYRDGFARSRLPAGTVRPIDYEEGKGAAVDFPTCVVSPPSYLFRIRRELALHEESTLLMWVLHPHNLLELFPFYHYYQNRRIEWIQLANRTLFAEDFRKIRGAIRFLIRHNGLYFMDESCFSFNRTLFDLRWNEAAYLPVASLDKRSEAPAAIVDGGAANIGWLGRLSQEKVYSLLNVAENADRYSARHGKKVVLHVIGEGPYRHVVEGYREESHLFEMRFVGALLGDDLDSYLARRVDVLFAMGTSCLEGAQLGLPTVLLGWSFQRIRKDYRYRWLFESTGYSLGAAANGERNLHSFEELMDEIYLRNRKGSLGERNRSYFSEHHSIAKVSRMLLGDAERDTATLGALAGETSLFETSLLFGTYLRAVKVKDRIKRAMSLR